MHVESAALSVLLAIRKSSVSPIIHQPPLHSPNSLLETGLRMCPREKEPGQWLPSLPAVRSLQSGLSGKNREKWACLAYFASKGQGRFSAVQTAWRRERDSNPRYGFPYSGFQDRLFQPLTHPSAAS